ncbi:MAG: 50S ribosomal protein L17 [Lentisphaerae bacterium]|nr:50S ribosomal protein L17 [Lentisphaerota bacterium]
MRHRVLSTTFGRSSAHRKALLGFLVCSLIEEKRIVTTLARAKAARALAERMVTLARAGSLAARRQIIATLRRRGAVKMLFEQIVPKCQDRAGGYTRIMHLGSRRGDAAPMAILEWVSIAPVDKKKKQPPAQAEAKPAPARAQAAAR